MLGVQGLFVLVAIASCGRPGRAPPPRSGPDPSQAIRAFRAFALAPAKLPPPSVTLEPLQASSRRLSGTAQVVRVEEESWNGWPGRELRLFNHRWAWVVEVTVDTPAGAVWRPQSTRLELNDTDTVLPPAPTADDVLGDLLFWALEQERHALGDDLVARTRGAGPFRGHYLDATGDEQWSGLVAFPLGDHHDKHVVAARLTLSFDTPEGRDELVWVFP